MVGLYGEFLEELTRARVGFAGLSASCTTRWDARVRLAQPNPGSSPHPVSSLAGAARAITLGQTRVLGQAGDHGEQVDHSIEPSREQREGVRTLRETNEVDARLRADGLEASLSARAGVVVGGPAAPTIGRGSRPVLVEPNHGCRCRMGRRTRDTVGQEQMVDAEVGGDRIGKLIEWRAVVADQDPIYLAQCVGKGASADHRASRAIRLHAVSRRS